MTTKLVRVSLFLKPTVLSSKTDDISVNYFNQLLCTYSQIRISQHSILKDRHVLWKLNRLYYSGADTKLGIGDA